MFPDLLHRKEKKLFPVFLLTILFDHQGHPDLRDHPGHQDPPDLRDRPDRPDHPDVASPDRRTRHRKDYFRP